MNPQITMTVMAILSLLASVALAFYSAHTHGGAAKTITECVIALNESHRVTLNDLIAHAAMPREAAVNHMFNQTYPPEIGVENFLGEDELMARQIADEG